MFRNTSAAPPEFPRRVIILMRTASMPDTLPIDPVCGMEVDPDTGVVTIDRFYSVDDVGKALNPMPYRMLKLNQPWENFDIAHELTTKGIQKFVEDYQSTLKRTA